MSSSIPVGGCCIPLSGTGCCAESPWWSWCAVGSGQCPVKASCCCDLKLGAGAARVLRTTHNSIWTVPGLHLMMQLACVWMIVWTPKIEVLKRRPQIRRHKGLQPKHNTTDGTGFQSLAERSVGKSLFLESLYSRTCKPEFKFPQFQSSDTILSAKPKHFACRQPVVLLQLAILEKNTKGTVLSLEALKS